MSGAGGSRAAAQPAPAATGAKILCATQRSGSMLLCELLIAAGVAGAPESFFMSGLDPSWADAWGMPRPDSLPEPEFSAARLAAALRAGRGATAVFGLRQMGRDRAALSALIDRVHPGLGSDRERFEAAFGRALCVHLSREDKAAQAVSLVRARQTGLWRVAPDGTEVERLAPPRPPRFDRARIARAMRVLAAGDAAWRDRFAAQGIEPLRLTCGSLAADPAAGAARVLVALGLQAPDPGRLRPAVGRLADAINADWLRRVRSQRRRARPALTGRPAGPPAAALPVAAPAAGSVAEHGHDGVNRRS